MINDVFSSVLSVAKVIYEQVQTARINSKQCSRLGGRVKIIVDSLEGLDKLPDNRHFELALEAFESLLKETSKFIGNFSQKHRVIRFLRASDYQEKFGDLNTRLQERMQDLGLGLNVQQVMNRDQDKVDQAEDLQYIKDHEEEILLVCQDLKADFSELKEQQEWIRDRMISMKNHLLGAGAQLPPPSPVVVHEASASAAASNVIPGLDSYDAGVACEGKGNFAEALVHYQRAIDTGDYFKACTRVGLFYLSGKGGLTQNKAEAAKYLEKGAAQNHIQALHTLGQMLEYGDGIPQDLSRAKDVYQRLMVNPSSTAEQKKFAQAKLIRVAEKIGSQNQ